MIEAGDVWVADLNNETRCRVVVVTGGRVGRRLDRVIVAPEFGLDIVDPLPPWRVRSNGSIFAVDYVVSVPLSRLLERSSRVAAAELAQVRRALRQMT